MATDLVIPVRDKATGQWRIVAIHVESMEADKTTYFGMIMEGGYETQQEAAMHSSAMYIELKKSNIFGEPQSNEGTQNRKQRRAKMSEAKKV